MLHFIAQSLFSAPDPLSAPGGVEVWLNQRSVVTGIGLVFVGVVLLAGPARSMKRGWVVALGVVLLGAAVWAGGRLYVSDYEAVDTATEAFYTAIEEGDRRAVDAFLAPDVGVAAAGVPLPDAGRAFVLSGVDRAREGGLNGLAREERQTEVYTDVSAKTQTFLRASIAGAGPTLTWVAIDWRKEGESWRVRGIDVLLINGQAPGRALLNAMR